jgi:site-specific recombinase XerD
MDVRDGCSGFLESRRITNLRPNTLRVHQMWFKLWINWRDGRGASLTSVDVSELRGFMAYLRDEYQAHKRNPRLEWADSGRLGDHSLRSAWRSLRALWTWLGEEGELSDVQGSFFPKRIPCPKVDEQPRPVYTQDMFDALLGAARSDDDPLMAARNVALLILLSQSGMRASEVCSMDMSRLHTDDSTAQVRRKGRKWGWVTWGASGRDALAEWLAVRPTVDHDKVFIGLGGRARLKPLTYNALRLSVERLEERAGIELPAGASIHAMRHWFAHRMLGAGVDGLHLQQMLAHTDIRTTQRYVEEHHEQLRKIHQAALERW